MLVKYGKNIYSQHGLGDTLGITASFSDDVYGAG
jgi:hypothetical protein